MAEMRAAIVCVGRHKILRELVGQDKFVKSSDSLSVDEMGADVSSSASSTVVVARR